MNKTNLELWLRINKEYIKSEYGDIMLEYFMQFEKEFFKLFEIFKCYSEMDNMRDQIFKVQDIHFFGYTGKLPTTDGMFGYLKQEKTKKLETNY